jgi:ketosteroid isomerase-like protein
MGIEDNKRVVLAYLTAMGTGELPPGLLADDVHWWLPRHGRLDMETFGEIVAKARPAMATPVSMTVNHITAEGDRVSAEVQGHCVTSDGQNYDNVYHFLFFLRGGQIVEVHEHTDTGYAYRVLGVNPAAHLEVG